MFSADEAQLVQEIFNYLLRHEDTVSVEVTPLLVLVNFKGTNSESAGQREQFCFLWVCPHTVSYDITLGFPSGN